MIHSTDLLAMYWALQQKASPQPADKPNPNEVWYYADSKATLFSSDNVASHTFSNGKGIIRYSSMPSNRMPGTLRGTSITGVALPDNVYIIGSNAFFGCSSLVNVTLPSDLTGIESYAFYNCGNLKLTELPSGVIYLDQGAFRGCSSITLSALPQNMTQIAREAFYDCSSLALTALPNGLKIIQQETFRGCSSMSLSALPDGITSIGQSAFFGCSRITMTTLPPGLTSIETTAFMNCTRLALTSLPDNIASIGDSAFFDCQNITISYIPDTVGSIGSMAFYHCLGITSLHILGNLDTLSNPFISCTNLKDIYVPWSENDVENAPWGAVNATITYLNQKMPADYLRMEGLLNTTSGNHWINTGLTTDISDIWTVTLLPIWGQSSGVMGGGISKTDSDFAIWYHGDTGVLELQFGNGNDADYKILVTVDPTQPHTIKMKLATGDAWVDGIYQGRSKYVAPLTTAVQLPIFGIWRGSKLYTPFAGAILECKIQRGDTLVRHYVPATLRKTELYQHGMMDLVAAGDDPATAFTSYANTITNNNASWTVNIQDDDLTYGFNLISRITNAEINWGDGTVDNVHGTDTSYSHTYQEAGSYNIQINAPYTYNFRLALGNTDTHSAKITSLDRMSSKYISESFARYAANLDFPASVISHVEVVCKYAFEGCSSLTLSSLPPNLIYLAEAIFKNCPSLTVSEIPAIVTEIGKEAFMNDTGLIISEFPASMKIVNTRSFNGCSAITLAELPDGITDIGHSVFTDCPLITISNIPDSVTKLGGSNFDNDPLITTMSVSANLKTLPYKSLAIPNMTTLIFRGTPDTIATGAISSNKSGDCYMPWSEGAISGALWGWSRGTAHYDYQP